jgi:septum formation protein
VTREDPTTLVLASSSAGRLGVLRKAGIDPVVIVSGVDETTEPGLDTGTIVAQLAARKAAAVTELVEKSQPGTLVLGCDSMLDLDGTAYGKPASAEEATALWRRMSGREGSLYTGHCLIVAGTDRRAEAVGRTLVRFGTPGEAELAAYVASGEPAVMAGAFSLEGLGAPFIDGIDGDPTNVIGLSVPLLRLMLAELGVPITELWREG